MKKREHYLPGLGLFRDSADEFRRLEFKLRSLSEHADPGELGRELWRTGSGVRSSAPLATDGEFLSDGCDRWKMAWSRLFTTPAV